MGLISHRIDTVENCIYCMKEHVKDDLIVTPYGKVINNHVRTIVRLFNIGGKTGHTWRCNRVLVTNYGTIPPLLGLEKIIRTT